MSQRLKSYKQESIQLYDKTHHVFARAALSHDYPDKTEKKVISTSKQPSNSLHAIKSFFFSCIIRYTYTQRDILSQEYTTFYRSRVSYLECRKIHGDYR